MVTKKQMAGIAFSLLFLAISCILFIQSYNSHRGIMDASNECFDKNGMPTVEKSVHVFSISWSVECKP
ncbi:hypothetical protein [Peribacillus simplex]|uniref:hypothetical protein n=1 Tax=Peribacillus simplex TaxID=1478 RepID=UPI003D29A4A2